MKHFSSFLALMMWILGTTTMSACVPKITFNYTGLENSTDATVFGTFDYNSTVADTNPASNIGDYPGAGFLTGTVTGGPQDGGTFKVTGLNVQVTNSFPGSSEHLTLRGSTHIDFNGFDGTAFSKDCLPVTLTLMDIEDNQLNVANSDIWAGVKGF